MSVFSFNVDPAEGMHWHQLAVLLRHAPDMARSLLHSPPPPGIPAKKCIAGLISSARRHGLTELLEKHLLSGFLLTPGDRQDQWHLSTDDFFRRRFPDADQDPIPTGPWIHVPILAVQGGNARVVAMMIGLLPDKTDCGAIGWSASDPGITKAVDTASALTGWTGGVAYWFLQQDENPLQGSSLALPVALALALLQNSIAWPLGLYATGGLKPDGSIVPVDHIREKYCSVACSCGLFLAPVETAPASDTDRSIQTCATFDDACFAATLYSGGTTAADISLYQACWISERNFFDHFHEIPMAMLFSDRAGRFYRLVQAAPDRYLDLLAGTFRRCNHDQQRGQILAELFDPDVIENLAGKSPAGAFPAFNWCLATIAFYNHCGRVRESERWSSCAERLRADVDLPEINRSINHDFVSRRFNRYDFRPEPTRMLAEALDREENKQKIYPGSNALLGALCGTLAQNYGFCGPDYFNALLDMTARARQAFGGKYHGESKRLLNYEIYACLDCGKTEQAMSLANAYLGHAESCRPEEWLSQTEILLESTMSSSPFKVALVMRLLHDIGSIPSPAHVGRIAAKICRRHGHPWQLTALNFGWLALTAGRNAEADQLFRHSIRICLADSDTMRPMALLALAGLHATGLAEKDEYCQAQEIRIWLRQTNCLKSDHFQVLLNLADSEELLHEVNRQCAHLFPFSYR